MADEELFPVSCCFELIIPVAGFFIFRYEKAWVLWYPIYLLLFPIFIASKIVGGLVNPPRLVVGTVRFSLFPLTAIVAWIASLTLLPFIWVVLWRTTQPNAILSMITAEVVLNTLILVLGLRWASEPTLPFVAFYSLLELVFRFLDKTHGSYQDKEGQARIEEVLREIAGYNSFTKLLNSTQQLFTTLVERRVVPLFTLILTMLFMMTVFGYGLAVYASQKMPLPAFQGLDEPSMSKSCMFSISVITTAPLSNVAPVTNVGHVIYSMELVSTFLILTVFISLFGGTMGAHWSQQLQCVTDMYNNLKSLVEGKQKKLAEELIPFVTSGQIIIDSPPSQGNEPPISVAAVGNPPLSPPPPTSDMPPSPSGNT